MIIEHVPHLKITETGTHLVVEIENEVFKSCPDLIFELQCQTPDSVKYTSVINFTQPTLKYRVTSVDSGNITHTALTLSILTCRVWTSEDILDLE